NEAAAAGVAASAKPTRAIYPRRDIGRLLPSANVKSGKPLARAPRRGGEYAAGHALRFANPSRFAERQNPFRSGAWGRADPASAPTGRWTSPSPDAQGPLS